MSRNLESTAKPPRPMKTSSVVEAAHRLRDGQKQRITDPFGVQEVEDLALLINAALAKQPVITDLKAEWTKLKTSYGGRATVKRVRRVVSYDCTDGVSDQSATFQAKNDQGLPSLATHWLNDGDHVVFISREAAVNFLERALKTLQPQRKKGVSK